MITTNPLYVLLAGAVGALIFLIWHARGGGWFSLAVMVVYESFLVGAVTLTYSECVLGVVLFVVAWLVVTIVIFLIKGARLFHGWAGRTCPRNLLYLALIAAVIAWALPLENVQPSDVPQGAANHFYAVIGAVPDSMYNAMNRGLNHKGGPILVFESAQSDPAMAAQ